jgi:hypothetical protein
MGKNLKTDTRGAMVIMGIPMMMLMIGFLYFVIGLGEQIVMRERMQDAADAGALSAAIMHARGMNMIALVNQVMAAIVAILVMIRLFQALMIAVAAIAAALAFWTAGASLSVVPPATQAANSAQSAFDYLKNITTPILRGLHVFELGLKYGMPIAAEARVIDTVAGHYSPPATIGFAIPGHYPLPVQDGRWRELCEKAGEYAGTLIMWPVDAVIGDNPVSDFIGSGIGAMAREFSAVFCDPNSSGGPELNIPDELPDIELDQAFERGIPESEAVAECNTQDPDVDINQREELCEQAAVEEGRARPGPDGGPNTSCTYMSPRTQAETPCEPCRGSDGSVCPEFTYRAQRAASECRPGGDIEVSSWTYQRRNFNWRANLVPVPLPPPADGEELVIPDDQDRLYTIEFVDDEPNYEDQGVYRSSTPPCGPGGSIATTYNSSSNYRPDGYYGSNEMLCEQPHLRPNVTGWNSEAGEGTDGLPLRVWRERFNHATWDEDEEDYTPAAPASWDIDDPWPPPTMQPPYVPEERPFFVGQWSAATFLLACSTTVERASDLELPEDPADAEEPPPADENSCGGGDQVHHMMEPGHELGSETFQLRAVVLGDSHREEAYNVVEQVPLRRHGQEREAGGLISGALDLASHVFVAQAEYYFDTTWNEGRGEVDQGPDEWMWNMSWRARLRRFRLPHDDEESGNDERESPQGGESCGFGTPAIDVGQACEMANSDSGESSPCPGGGFLDRLQELAETVMVH